MWLRKIEIQELSPSSFAHRVEHTDPINVLLRINDDQRRTHIDDLCCQRLIQPRLSCAGCSSYEGVAWKCRERYPDISLLGYTNSVNPCSADIRVKHRPAAFGENSTHGSIFYPISEAHLFFRYQCQP
ncbi:hypothetical protein D9M69_684350 [compost metagenome]